MISPQQSLAEQPLVVTSDQLSEGYYERAEGIVYHRQFWVIRRLRDGNYLVRDPDDKSAAEPC